MSIGDKEVFPYQMTNDLTNADKNYGIPYRLWLIGQALANSNMAWMQNSADKSFAEETAKGIILQVDTLIKQLDSEKQGG